MLTRSRVRLSVKLEQTQLRPGEEVRGVLEVTVTQKIDVTAVRVRISGKEESYIRKNGRHTKRHEFIYLDKLFTVFGFTKSSGRRGGASLSPGDYSYPFHLLLPHSLPPTYFAQAKKARCAMRYRVEGIVDVPSGLNGRVSRRFTVLASAPRAQIRSARDFPTEHTLIRAHEKRGLFSKGGGYAAVAVTAAPSVVRFASEPVLSDDDVADDSSDADDNDGERDGDQSLSLTATSSAAPTSTVSADVWQVTARRAVALPLADPDAPPVNPGVNDNYPMASTVPPPLYQTPDPVRARRGSHPVTPEGGLPATVARQPLPPPGNHRGSSIGTPSPRASASNPDVTAAAAATALSFDDLFNFGYLQRHSASAPPAGSPDAHRGSGVGLPHAEYAAAEAPAVTGPYATEQPLPPIVSNLFGGVAVNDIEPVEPAAHCCAADEVSSNETEEEEPRTIPRGRHAESFDESLHEAAPPSAAPTAGAPPTVPPPPSSVTQPTVASTRQRRSVELGRQRRSRCVMLPPNEQPSTFAPPASDAEMALRLTITNGTKKELKSVEILLVEMTELMVGHRVRRAQQILASTTLKLPKHARKAQTVVLDATMRMRRMLRTRGKNGSRRLPLPTLFTSMCKTKTCLKVELRGIKLETAFVWTNVLHLVNSADGSNLTVPGPLLFTTQHLLPEE